MLEEEALPYAALELASDGVTGVPGAADTIGAAGATDATDGRNAPVAGAMYVPGPDAECVPLDDDEFLPASFAEVVPLPPLLARLRASTCN